MEDMTQSVIRAVDKAIRDEFKRLCDLSTKDKDKDELSLARAAAKAAAKAAIEAMPDNPHVRIATMTDEDSNLITICVKDSGCSVIAERGDKEACFKALLYSFISDIYEAKDWDMDKAVKYVRSVCEKVMNDYAKGYE